MSYLGNLADFNGDPQYIAEEKLLDLTECLCGMSDQESRKFKILLWLLERVAGMMIYDVRIKTREKTDE